MNTKFHAEATIVEKSIWQNRIVKWQWCVLRVACS